MVYKKQCKCEMCGKIVIARTSRKRFCEVCKIENNREWKKEWLKNPLNNLRTKEIAKISRSNHLETKRKLRKKYVQKYPNKIMAQQMAQQIPLQKECGICKSKTGMERHHWRYDKPLFVATLCKSCHTIQHIKHFVGGI
jgi:hypothetical protein